MVIIPRHMSVYMHISIPVWDAKDLIEHFQSFTWFLGHNFLGQFFCFQFKIV